MTETIAETPHRPSRLTLVLVLGSLTALAPLAIDMYLPAMPRMEAAFDTDSASVQRTLATFFLGFALGQLAIGPFLDRFGRKPPLLIGLLLFTVSSAACAWAPNVETLAVLRFFQACGACAGGVVSRAMVRDLFPPHEMARVLSMLVLVMGAAPMLAPLAGGLLLRVADWDSIFLALAGFGLLSTAASQVFLRESQAKEHRQSMEVARLAGTVRMLLRDRRFMAPSLLGGVAMAGMFCYIATSSFVFMEHYGMSAQGYSILFGSNAAGFVVAAQVNGHLLAPGRQRHTLWIAGCFHATFALGLLITAGSGIGGWPLLAPLLFGHISCLGFMLPNSTTLAMENHGPVAGMASALLGSLQFAIAAIATEIVSSFGKGSPVAMTVAMTLCSAVSLALNATVRFRRQPEG